MKAVFNNFRKTSENSNILNIGCFFVIHKKSNSEQFHIPVSFDLKYTDVCIKAEDDDVFYFSASVWFPADGCAGEI